MLRTPNVEGIAWGRFSPPPLPSIKVCMLPVERFIFPCTPFPIRIGRKVTDVSYIEETDDITGDVILELDVLD